MNVKSSLPAIVLVIILLILVVLDWTGCGKIGGIKPKMRLQQHYKKALIIQKP